MTRGCVLFVAWETRLGTFSWAHPTAWWRAASSSTWKSFYPSSLLQQGHQSQLFRTMFWISSKFKTSFSLSNLHQWVETLFMNIKIFRKNKNAQKSPPATAIFILTVTVLFTKPFTSTTPEQAIFWDYGEGMQQLLVKLTSLQVFLCNLVFSLNSEGKTST